MNRADKNPNGQERRKLNFRSPHAGRLIDIVVGSYGQSFLVVAKMEGFKELQ